MEWRGLLSRFLSRLLCGLNFLRALRWVVSALEEWQWVSWLGPYVRDPGLRFVLDFSQRRAA